MKKWSTIGIREEFTVLTETSCTRIDWQRQITLVYEVSVSSVNSSLIPIVVHFSIASYEYSSGSFMVFIKFSIDIIGISANLGSDNVPR